MKKYSEELSKAVALLEKKIANGCNDEDVFEAKKIIGGVIGLVELDDCIEE